MNGKQLEQEALWYSVSVRVKSRENTEFAEVTIDSDGCTSYKMVLGLPALEALRVALNTWRAKNGDV